MDRNIALDIILPKVCKKEIKILNEHQRNILLKNSYNYRYGVFIRLTLCTGLRLGELLALKWSDIDFENKKLYVKRTINRLKNYDCNIKNKTKIYFDKPKSINSFRIIPLPQNAIYDLLAWRKIQSEENYKTAFIVTTENGNFVEHNLFKRHYNKLLEDCNITGITFHALRHTFATMALEKGMDSKVLSEILGHYSVAFTLDTYTHVLDNFKIQNMQLMNDVYLRGEDKKSLILKFKKFKDKYIVSIPQHEQYTFISESIEEGIEYINKNKSNIILDENINLNILFDRDNFKDSILVLLK